MEEQRRKLEKLIEQGADYSEILKQSQELDKLIVAYYQERR